MSRYSRQPARHRERSRSRCRESVVNYRYSPRLCRTLLLATLQFLSGSMDSMNTMFIGCEREEVEL